MEKSSMPITFEDVSIQVCWGYIKGRWYGTKSVRPILALHGWLDNYGTWNTLVPLMPSHIGVLAIDLPGHGKSSPLPEGVFYHALEYVADILRVMHAFNWDKVSIMGHSMSAIDSFLFASLFPKKVDILIQIDALHPYVNPTPDSYIDVWSQVIENYLVEEERKKKRDLNEPPSYSYEEVIQRYYIGSNRSVDKDKCVHIIENNIAKSTKYPSQYYFSRDSRLKHVMPLPTSEEVLVFLAKRIKIPQLVIKASKSNYIDENGAVIKILRSNNPHFDFHIVEGTHHVHLNDAPTVSVLVKSFINKWRPPQTLGNEPQNASNGEPKNQKVFKAKL